MYKLKVHFINSFRKKLSKTQVGLAKWDMNWSEKLQGFTVDLVTVTLWMAPLDSNLSQSRIPPVMTSSYHYTTPFLCI